MIQGRSFLYSGLDRIVYHINENGVRAIQSWSLDEIVAFVDGDMESYEPSFMLFDSKVQIIMASSPEGANAKWTDQAGGVKAIVTEPWSPRELFLAGFVLGSYLSTLNSCISLGYSFIPLISLLSCSRSRPCISATILVDAFILPPPCRTWKRRRR